MRVPAGAGTRDPVEWLCTSAPRLLLFAGKGGVGKSTCAAAAAITLSDTRAVLLCGTDPAGSLGDVLGAGLQGGGGLRVVQIDPGARLEGLRRKYREEVVGALERIGLAGSAELDRRVIESLWDLAPPGLDELAATAAMLDAARSRETVVIDSAPTGHFLRLLGMPELALDWTRQLMRVIVKYGITGPAADAAASLLNLSRELKALQASLHDSASAAVFVVTLGEPMVQAETDRLISALALARVHVGAVLVNRTHGSLSGAPAARQSSALIFAPELDPPPIGDDALRGFVRAWNIVT
jgi:arsenite-transporting ATPase